MATKPNHKGRAHAVLSASASDRWMHCTPSARYTENLPDNTSAAAAEGTMAHEIAESCLRAYLVGAPEPRYAGEDQERIYEEVHPYVERAIETYLKLKAENADTEMFVEVKMDISEWIPDGFGTADLVFVSGDTLIVRDLKFGTGVAVDARGNPQLRIYALGVYKALCDIYELNHVRTEIDQVRLDMRSYDEMTVEELLTWADEVLKPKAEEAYAGKGEFCSGSHCIFCKANATCLARGENHMDVCRETYTLQSAGGIQYLSDDDIAELLDRTADVVSFTNALHDYALKRALAGDPIPGWKAVEGRANRAYTGTSDVYQALCDHLGEAPDISTYFVPVSITKMTTLLKGKKTFERVLGNYVYKPEGKPKLVKAEDSRDAIGESTAVTDFIDVEVTEVIEDKEKK